jgi:hypothetical protein
MLNINILFDSCIGFVGEFEGGGGGLCIFLGFEGMKNREQGNREQRTGKGGAGWF